LQTQSSPEPIYIPSTSVYAAEDTEAKDIAPFRAILKKGEEGWYYESKF